MAIQFGHGIQRQLLLDVLEAGEEGRAGRFVFRQQRNGVHEGRRLVLLVEEIDRQQDKLAKLGLLDVILVAGQLRPGEGRQRGELQQRDLVALLDGRDAVDEIQDRGDIGSRGDAAFELASQDLRRDDQTRRRLLPGIVGHDAVERLTEEPGRLAFLLFLVLAQVGADLRVGPAQECLLQHADRQRLGRALRTGIDQAAVAPDLDDGIQENAPLQIAFRLIDLPGILPGGTGAQDLHAARRLVQRRLERLAHALHRAALGAALLVEAAHVQDQQFFLGGPACGTGRRGAADSAARRLRPATAADRRCRPARRRGRRTQPRYGPWAGWHSGNSPERSRGRHGSVARRPVRGR